MKKLLFAIFLSASSAVAQNGLNPQNWYALDNYWGSGSNCISSANLSASAGQLMLSTTYGSYTCPGSGTLNYLVPFIIQKNFWFTYGTVAAVIKFGGTGSHDTGWMWGGAPGTPGYPPTCVSTIEAKATYIMEGCIASGSTPYVYEMDFAEHQPVNQNNTTINYTLHQWANSGSTNNTLANGYCTLASDITANFHTYTFSSVPGTITISQDGTTCATISYDLNVPMTIILDNETDAGAPPEGPSYYPTHMYVQSVTVTCNAYSTVSNMASCPNGTVAWQDTFSGVVPAALLSGSAKLTGKATIQ